MKNNADEVCVFFFLLFFFKFDVVIPPWTSNKSDVEQIVESITISF